MRHVKLMKKTRNHFLAVLLDVGRYKMEEFGLLLVWGIPTRRRSRRNGRNQFIGEKVPGRNNHKSVELVKKMFNPKSAANSSLVLRSCALAFALASFAVLLADNVTVSLSDAGDTHVSFKDFYSYRYVFVIAVIGVAYLLIQLPLAIYYVCTGKRLIKGDFCATLDFFGDKVVCGLMVSGVGAGFAVTTELKRYFETEIEGMEKFFDKGYVAAGLLLGAYVCMSFVSIFSSIQRAPGRRTFYA